MRHSQHSRITETQTIFSIQSNREKCDAFHFKNYMCCSTVQLPHSSNVTYTCELNKKKKYKSTAIRDKQFRYIQLTQVLDLRLCWCRILPTHVVWHLPTWPFLMLCIENCIAVECNQVENQQFCCCSNLDIASKNRVNERERRSRRWRVAHVHRWC